MSSSYVSSKIRKRVALRAGQRCEYCLLPQDTSYYSFHIDHVRPEKHGGKTIIDNLAFACPSCNSYKGSDISTYIPNTDNIVRLFNPRIDEWREHFENSDSTIIGKTDIGKATIRLLHM
ncbi:MAG: HNH endonuclease signature motif containing protein, partial [Bacteroidota bacterium]